MSGARLIVNADDFGLSRGITDAIIIAHRHGVVTSTSVMANQKASDYALSLLDRAPSLGVGIHLNLTEGRPVLPARQVPSLVAANGYFHPRAVLFRKLWRFGISSDEMAAEFQAQICWLRERGVIPTHADSHLHVHLYPAAIRPFTRAVESEGIRCIRSPLCTSWPAKRIPGSLLAGTLPRRMLVQSYRTVLHKTLLRRFASPDGRISFGSDDRNDISRIRHSWLSALDSLAEGTFELACHPGITEEGFSASDRIAAQREEELHWLTNSESRDAVERNHIRLITYRELLSEAISTQSVSEAPVSMRGKWAC